MITNTEKIKILHDRMIMLNLMYDELDLTIREKNDGQPGSKEWCQNAKIELNDILLAFNSLSEEMERIQSQA